MTTRTHSTAVRNGPVAGKPVVNVAAEVVGRGSQFSISAAPSLRLVASAQCLISGQWESEYRIRVPKTTATDIKITSRPANIHAAHGQSPGETPEVHGRIAV